MQSNDLSQLQFFHPPVDHIPEEPILSGTQYSIPPATASDTLYSIAPVHQLDPQFVDPSISNAQPEDVFNYQNVHFSQPQNHQCIEVNVEEPVVQAQGMCS